MDAEHPRRTDAPLTHGQGTGVLRYWLSGVRLEEALKTRPRARTTRHAENAPRLDTPSGGQDYFKLMLASEVAPLFASAEPHTKPFDGELSAFFEDWLNTQYRRGADEGEVPHLLCFPVVHLARGELAGLLRFGVRLRFTGEDGAQFRAPTRAERKRAAYPPPPGEVRVARAPLAEGALPFFIDTRLLGFPLGLAPEQIDALFERLRARESWSEFEMLALVTEALEQAAESAAPEARAGHGGEHDEQAFAALLARLRSAMRALLSRSSARAEVYPVGIVIDGTQAKTTWHLQRELTGLIEAHGKDAWARTSSLGAYLTHAPLSTGEAPQRALFRGPPLTAHQRHAAEHFWGSTLTSVQGPPGTGKTTLILHLCAEAIVRQLDGLLDRKQMGSALLLVASGNNRAVDNVIDPLTSDMALPLGLRVGNRQVCEHVLAPALRRTIHWLERALVEAPLLHGHALTASLAEFARVRSELEELLAPRRLALAGDVERTRLQAALSALESERAGPDAAPDLPVALARALEAVLAQAALHLELPLPPLNTPLDVAALMEEWEEGAELLLDRLSAVRDRVTRALTADNHARKVQELRAHLAALGPAGALPDVPEHDALSRALFEAAVAAREAWAKVNARVLIDALKAALEVAEQERSLRGLFRHDPDSARWLCRLFCVWGSTLLSLGNCLPADADTAASVVIDEAGQCHPAHAVSALMRAGAAMVIGDVFQLPPVIDLSSEDDARLLKSARLEIDPARLAPYRLGADSQVSAQSLAERAVATRHVLVDHFRCQPEIIAISNALCHYGLVVHTPPMARHGLLAHPVSLRDLAGEQQRLHGSLWNELELRETLKLTMQLLGRGASPREIAIITPYRGQLDHLRRGLQALSVPLEFSPELLDSEQPTQLAGAGLALGTVHRFQGGERSIVLFSSVVTEPSSLGFLNQRPNLLNVAVSRAQHHLVCLGDRRVLMAGRFTRLLAGPAVAL